jgi:hypothetical protein
MIIVIIKLSKLVIIVGFYGDLMGFMVVYWDLMGLYPLVNVYIAIV